MFFLSSEFIPTKLIFLMATLLLLSKKSIINTLDNTLSFGLLIGISSISFFNGILNNEIEGVFDEFKTYIFWPIIIFVVFSIKYSKNDCLSVLKIFSNFVLFMPMIMAILLFAYLLGFGEYLKLPSGGNIVGIGINEGTISINLININFLIFGSFLLISALTFNRIKIFSKSKTTIVLSLLSYIFIFLISGRKGWYLSMVFVVIFSLVMTWSTISRKHVFVGVALSIICIMLLFKFANIDMEVIQEKIIESFDPDSGGGERHEQFNAMIYALQDKIALGYGLGSSVEGSVRNIDKPWHYELTYIKLFLNMGIPMAVVFISICMYLMVKLINCKSEYGFVFVSILGYIIISGTNPYLSNFDTMWIIFLPVLFSNYSKIQINTYK